MSKYNIVYEIINKINNKIYIGCHQTDKLEDGYMGSGTYLHKAFKKYGIDNFERIVLYNFDTFEEMFAKEAELVNEEFVKRKDVYNIMLGGYGWNTKGLVLVKDKKNNKTLMLKSDSRYNNEYFPISIGKVNVIDKEGNSFKCDVNNIKLKSGEYQYQSKYFSLYKDKNNNIIRCRLNDSRVLSSELVGIMKHKTSVKDKDGNKFWVNVDDPRYLSGELVGIQIGRKLAKEHREKISKANKISQLGSRNSQYGKCWIHNLEEKKSIRVKKEEVYEWINKGWIKGRKLVFKNNEKVFIA